MVSGSASVASSIASSIGSTRTKKKIKRSSSIRKKSRPPPERIDEEMASLIPPQKPRSNSNTSSSTGVSGRFSTNLYIIGIACTITAVASIAGFLLASKYASNDVQLPTLEQEKEQEATLTSIIAQKKTTTVQSSNTAVTKPTPSLAATTAITKAKSKNTRVFFNLDELIVDHTCKNGFTPCPCNPKDNDFASKDDGWKQVHDLNIKDIHKFTNKTKGSTSNMDILFLGDSIIEQWNGRWHGTFNDRFEEIPPVFESYFGQKGLALGIAADTCIDLYLRITNGELPKELNPKVIWILIGTNDLRWCHGEAIFYGVLKIVNEVHLRKPNAEIVVNGILPRGAGNLELMSMWHTIQDVNKNLSKYCDLYESLHYFNGTDIFLNEDGNIRKELMRDYLHPTADGHRLWADEIIKFSKNLTKSR